MIRNNFFKPSRFGSYLYKEIAENWRVILLRIGLMYTSMTIVFLFAGVSFYNNYHSVKKVLVEDPMQNYVYGSFFVFIIIFSMLGSSLIMEKLKTKTGRLSFLMVPATSFEKYFSRWFLYTIGTLVLFFITFHLADLTRYLVYSVCYPQIESISLTNLTHMFSGDYLNRTMIEDKPSRCFAVAIFLFSQSFFALGSSFWAKNSFIKTLIVGVFIIAAYSLIIGYSGYFFLNDKQVHFSMEEEYFYIIAIFFFLLAALNWILAYYRFKEAEIINRK